MCRDALVYLAGRAVRFVAKKSGKPWCIHETCQSGDLPIAQRETFRAERKRNCRSCSRPHRSIWHRWLLASVPGRWRTHVGWSPLYQAATDRPDRSRIQFRRCSATKPSRTSAKHPRCSNSAARSGDDLALYGLLRRYHLLSSHRLE